MNMAQLPISSSTRGKHVYKPYTADTKCDAITLTWESESPLGKGYCYEIFYKEKDKGKFIAYKSEESCYMTSISIGNLKPNTAYVFKVRIVHEESGEESPYSPLSDFVVTEASSISVVKDHSKLIKNEPIELYRLQIKEQMHARNDHWHTRKFTFGRQTVIKEKGILLVGATGSGKSTLVNALANYAIGVRREDTCRFQMVQLEENERGLSEAQSQTQWVTCYTIYTDKTCRLPYNITIIDTPGFGHTAGIKNDEFIVEQIRELFKAPNGKGVTCIDAICFVVKSPDARLTISQKYIFRSILALFGKDIRDNICTIVTFADGQEPPVLQALSQLDEKPIPYEIYFPVNNSAMFSSNSDQNPSSTSTKFFWNLAMESYNNFFNHIELLSPKSLLLTTKVLCIRQAKENTISNLQLELDRGFMTLQSINEELQVFKQHTREIKDNKDFTYQVEESMLTKVDIRGRGIFTTNCLTCNYTCHSNCAYGNDDDKAKCIAMNEDGICTECPQKCSWKLHHNVPYVFKVVKTKVTKTYQEKKLAYESAMQKKLSQKDIVQIQNKEIDEIQENIDTFLSKITHHSNQLKRIALLPDMLSTVEYIELLIQTEEQIKTEGFLSRIKELQRCKERALIRKTTAALSSKLQIAKETYNDD